MNYYCSLQISCLLTLTAILSRVPTPSVAQNELYEDCGKSFQCANIPNIGYPFWGGNRPGNCGHPSFELSCHGDAPQIAIQSGAYRVLAVDGTNRVLTLVRAELWNNTCPEQLQSAVIDSLNFKYVLNSQDLNLYYNCQAPVGGMPMALPYQFSCHTKGRDTIGYHSLTSGTVAPPISNIDFKCNTSIIVRVNQTAASALAHNPPLITIKEAIDSGFGVQWEANNTSCDRCVQSGGRCGSNSSSTFVCYCSDQPYSLVCGSSDSSHQDGSGMSLTQVIILIYSFRRRGPRPFVFGCFNLLGSCFAFSAGWD